VFGNAEFQTMASSCFTANPLSNREMDFPIGRTDRTEVGQEFRNSFTRPREGRPPPILLAPAAMARTKNSLQ